MTWSIVTVSLELDGAYEERATVQFQDRPEGYIGVPLKRLPPRLRAAIKAFLGRNVADPIEYAIVHAQMDTFAGDTPSFSIGLVGIAPSSATWPDWFAYLPPKLGQEILSELGKDDGSEAKTKKA